MPFVYRSSFVCFNLLITFALCLCCAPHVHVLHKFTSICENIFKPKAPDVMVFFYKKTIYPYTIYLYKVQIARPFCFLRGQSHQLVFFFWNSTKEYFCNPPRFPSQSFNILANDQEQHTTHVIPDLLLHICEKWLKGGGLKCTLLEQFWGNPFSDWSTNINISEDSCIGGYWPIREGKRSES